MNGSSMMKTAIELPAGWMGRMEGLTMTQALARGQKESGRWTESIIALPMMV